jgi:peptide chain release factor 2
VSSDISLDDFKKLESRLSDLLDGPNRDEIKSELVRLDRLVSAQDFWADRASAEKLLGELSVKRKFIEQTESLEKEISELMVLWQLAQEAEDSKELAIVLQELKSLEFRVDRLHVDRMLSGEYDSRSAVMAIRSGAGGDDATDFAEMLMRMYLRYADLTGMNATVLDSSQAEGAGIKSATIRFDAPYAFGKLSVESGTHRLVRMSPFNAAGKRQTSFAAVEVVPLIESSDEIAIPDNEIRVDVFRSSGPGGQSVNTTDSAVRVTHIPTGTVVSCQNEKSQLQNKIEAMRVLQSRLLEFRRMEENAEKRKLAGDVKASWGEQMRSYVLAPYRMVKDLRTEYEENNPDDVFSGKLDGFISAGIKWRAQQNL